MTPVPLDLPVRTGEAALLAALVIEQAGVKRLTDELRNRLAGRAALLKMESIRPHFGSLERDPVHNLVFYLAVDGLHDCPLLLRMAPASSPSSGLFPKSLLIGRMRPAMGQEIVVNAIPFGPSDEDPLRVYSEKVNTSFLPRPQGTQSSITVNASQAAFEAFRSIFKRSGTNLCAVRGPYLSALWAAIRAGWREGYTLEAEPLQAAAVESGREVVRRSAGYTRFCIEAPHLESSLDGVCTLFDFIRQTKDAQRRRAFDFEFSMESTGVPTTPEALSSCLNNLKQGGRAAQLVAPCFTSRDESRVRDMAAIARQFQATLSVRLEEHVNETTLDVIASATLGRVNLKLSGDHIEDLPWIAERVRG